MKKSMKGFTLVELIVVIAIIGVLAAILVPAMMGWIAKANISTADGGAKQIYTNAQAIFQEIESKGGDPAAEGATITSADDFEYDLSGGNTLVFKDEMVRKMADSKDSVWQCEIAVDEADYDLTDVGTVVAAVYNKTDSNQNYIGTYPSDPENKKGAYGDESEALTKAIELYTSSASGSSS